VGAAVGTGVGVGVGAAVGTGVGVGVGVIIHDLNLKSELAPGDCHVDPFHSQT
jgi:hypothetical protein